jgi:putative transposase
VPRTRPPYPEEFRREAIRLARLGDKPHSRLARDLGISDVTLRNWLKEEKTSRGERPGGLSSDEREELKRLREVYSLIAAEKTNFPVAGMCGVLGVSRTGFHKWERRAPADRALGDAWLIEKIKRIYEDSRGVYGAPRIHAELRMDHGLRVGRKRVGRLMKAAGISGVRPRVPRSSSIMA